MALTTSNGATDPELPFVTLVSNTQTPLNPKGDVIVGNFEMQFTAEAPFNFPGGGLIIRFSNPSAAYQADIACTDVMTNGENSDASDFFEIRFFNDADGLHPYPAVSGGFIGAFQVIGTGEPPSGPLVIIPTMGQWGMIIATILLGFFAIAALRRRIKS